MGCLSHDDTSSEMSGDNIEQMISVLPMHRVMTTVYPETRTVVIMLQHDNLASMPIACLQEKEVVQFMHLLQQSLRTCRLLPFPSDQ